MSTRRILFGLAILLTAGLVLYGRSRTRRQRLIRRSVGLRESMTERAGEAPASEAEPEASDAAAASLTDEASEPESEPEPAAEVAPIPIRRSQPAASRARHAASSGRLPVRQLAGAALMLLALAWSFGPLRGASAATTTYVTAPTADAFVWSTNPDRNYGDRQQIRVDGSPVMESYLLFNVPGFDGPVTRATLRVYASSWSSFGYEVHGVASTTWGEATITFNNAPAIDAAAAASSGPIAGGTWTSVDVTSLIASGGPVSMALVTTGPTQISLGSRESGATSPRLVVETAGLSVAATSTATSAAPLTATATGVATTVPPTATPTATSVATTATSTATSPSGGGDSAALPLRAAFYYPWFSPAWTQQGIYPYTKYHPTLGYYDVRNQATIKSHIAAMQYGNISAGIASWWGQGSYTDARIADLLTAAGGTGFKWSIYYENESQGDPSVSQLTADLTYIRDHYASSANFLRINGKFVVFVYADAADACGMADRWKQANTVNAYVVLKVFPGYATCGSQPDSWHQYSPAVAADSQGSYSYAISPGFDKVGEATRLARDLTRWQQNVADMAASSAAFQLVTTFNEWGEGTAVESASEWASPSGYGAYLDALHNSPVSGSVPPSATPPATTSTPAPTLTPTPTPAATSPTASPTTISVLPTPTASATPGSSSTLSFAPIADAYIHSLAPDSNYGTGTSLRVDGSPIVESYLRFDVQGAGPITSATLRVWATSSQSAGYVVHGVADNSWSETGITFNNAPLFDTSSAGASGPVAASSWVSVDVTSLVSGNGQVSFALLTPSVTALALSSRESGATAPQLVVLTDGGSGGAPSPTPTAPSGPPPTPTATSVPPTATPVPPTATPAPPTPTVPPGASATLVGAGDIAGCSSTGDEATAALVNNIPGTVFTLGDNAYDNGTATEYATCYDPSWGAFRDRTRPAPGNHDYNTAGAAPYYGYFGANAGDPTKGYYSYNLGAWHIVVLNGMCSAVGGCGVGSPQETWLKADLAANPTACTLAYWHFPLFSSGGTHGNNPAYKVFWDDLYAAGAEVVLNGHEHNYERFAPQTSSAVADPARGIREFVVGTGGKNHYGFSSTIQPNSEVRNSTAFGVLKLTLDSNSYSWQFIPVAGQSFTDSGTTACH